MFEVLKGSLFLCPQKFFWTKKVRGRCNDPNGTRAGAFESLLLKVTFEYPSCGSATQRKVSTGDLS